MRSCSASTRIWCAGSSQLKEHLARFGDKLPPQIARQLEALEARLG